MGRPLHPPGMAPTPTQPLTKFIQCLPSPATPFFLSVIPALSLSCHPRLLPPLSSSTLVIEDPSFCFLPSPSSPTRSGIQCLCSWYASPRHLMPLFSKKWSFFAWRLSSQAFTGIYRGPVAPYTFLFRPEHCGRLQFFDTSFSCTACRWPSPSSVGYSNGYLNRRSVVQIVSGAS